MYRYHYGLFSCFNQIIFIFASCFNTTCKDSFYERTILKFQFKWEKYLYKCVTKVESGCYTKIKFQVTVMLLQNRNTIFRNTKMNELSCCLCSAIRIDNMKRVVSCKGIIIFVLVQ